MREFPACWDRSNLWEISPGDQLDESFAGMLHPLSSIMSKIHIPTPLRQYVGKQATIEVKASTVAEAMDALLKQHPDLRRHLYTEEGKLRAFVNVYVNDEDIRYLQKEATTLKEGDNISIVPSIAGGSELV